LNQSTKSKVFLTFFFSYWSLPWKVQPLTTWDRFSVRFYLFQCSLVQSPSR